MELSNIESLSFRVNIILFLLIVIMGGMIIGYYYIESQKSWIDLQMIRAENIIRINTGYTYGANITDIDRTFKETAGEYMRKERGINGI